MFQCFSSTAGCRSCSAGLVSVSIAAISTLESLGFWDKSSGFWDKLPQGVKFPSSHWTESSGLDQEKVISRFASKGHTDTNETALKNPEIAVVVISFSCTLHHCCRLLKHSRGHRTLKQPGPISSQQNLAAPINVQHHQHRVQAADSYKDASTSTLTHSKESTSSNLNQHLTIQGERNCFSGVTASKI